MGYSNVTGDLNVQSTITSQNVYVFGSTTLNTLTTTDGTTINGTLSVPGNSSFGKIITSNLTVTGNFTVTTTNTAFSNALSVNNAGTATALKVVQFEPTVHTHNVAEFWDYQTLAMVIDPEGNVGIHTTNTGLFGLSVVDGANVDSLQALTVSTGTLSTPLANVTTLNVGTLANINLLNVYSELTTTFMRVDDAFVTNLNVTTTNSLTYVTTNNVYAANALQTTNVLAVTTDTTYLVATNNVYAANAVQTTNVLTLTLEASNNLYAANALFTTNVLATTANLTTGNATYLVALNNVYAANAIQTTNVIATTINTTTLNIVSEVATNNIYVSNSIQTTNVYASTANLTTGNATYLVALNNVYAANSIRTTNVIATTINTTTHNTVSEVATNNVYASNAIQTTNVYAATANLTTGNASTFIALNNVYAANAIQTTNLTSTGNTSISNMKVQSFNFTVASGAGSYTNVCSITDSPHGSGIYAVSAEFMSRGAGGSAMTRSYMFTCNYNATTGNWTRVIPTSRPSGNNQLALDARTSGGVTTLRATNLGANEVVSAGIVLRVSSTSFSTVNITDLTTQSDVGATSTGFYPTSVYTQNNGLVGISTENPTSNLHVVGNIYASNSIQTINVLATTSNVTTGNATYFVALNNVYAANSLFSTNVYATTSNVTTGNTTYIVALNANVSTFNASTSNTLTGNVSTLTALAANVATFNGFTSNTLTGNVSTFTSLGANVTTFNAFQSNTLTGNVSTFTSIGANVTTLNAFQSNTLTGNVSTFTSIGANVTTLNAFQSNTLTGNVSILTALAANVTTFNAFTSNTLTGNVSTLTALAANVTTFNAFTSNTLTGNVSTLTAFAANVTTFNAFTSNTLTGNVSTLTAFAANVTNLNVITSNTLTGNVSSLSVLNSNIYSLNVESYANVTNMTITNFMNVATANIQNIVISSAISSTTNSLTANSVSFVATNNVYAANAVQTTNVLASTVSATSLVGNFYGPIVGSNTVAASAFYGPVVGSNTIEASTITATNLVGSLYGPVVGSNTISASTIYGTIAGSNTISGSTITGTFYGPVAGSNTIAASTVTATNLVGSLYGPVVGSNTISASTIYGTITGSNTISGSTIIGTFYGPVAGSNTIAASTVTATSLVGTHYGVIAGSNTISASTIYGTISGSNTISASTVTATSLIGTFYGPISGSNTIAGSTITGTFYGPIDGSNTIAASTVTATNLVGTHYGVIAGSNTVAASTLTLGTALSIGNGGTGQTTKANAFDALSPMTTLGDFTYGGTSGTGTRLAPNSTGTLKFLSETSSTPSWVTISDTDLPTVTFSPGSSGTYGSSSAIPVVTVDTYGRITGVTTQPATGLSGLTTYGVLYASSSSAVATTATGSSGEPLLSGGAGAGPAYGTLGLLYGGTGQTTKSAAFDALSPMTTLGDLIYGGASGSNSRLVGSTSATRAFLSQTGNGTVSGAPSWVTSLPLNQFSGVVAGGVAYGSATTTIATNSAGTSGQALLSGGAGAPTWGTLQVANGGTGVTTSTGSGNNVLSASPTLTGTLTCAAITSSGGTIQTSYAQGTNSPATGQAYFYNPTNSANQDASVGVRLAGPSARNCYYSYDVAGVAGFSHGILGSNQNLVFRASWDMTTATIFTMDRSGNFTASASVSANSDRRLKSNIEPITDALEKVDKISGYTFTRNDIENNPRQAGVIAQEILEVLPEVVNKDDNGMYTVAYGNITALLIQALKEEKKKRESLEERILKLENNIAHQ